MIDEEVETVLREIRERVISQPLPEPIPAGPARGGANGNQTSQLLPSAETSLRSTEALARLNAHLTTTARAWDRLPPVFSNRTGTAGRIEVWIKARLKIFSRWFTWEQINFNAAVHHALGETLKTITEQDAAITAQSMQLAAARTEQEAMRVEIQTQRDEIDSLRAQMQADTAARRIDLQNQGRETNALRAEVRGELEGVRIRAEDQAAELRAKIEAGTSEAAAQLAKLSSELRDRADRIENEQRVCFKQLSLETNETFVSNQRAQQQSRALLEEMNQRIKELEDSATQ
jgi:ribosome-associated translation inhibitor RaiA